jgi:hypothetical protein
MKKKKFDCVEMKNTIQKRLRKETAGLTAEERNKRLEKALATNPILGPFLKKVTSSKKRPIK